MSADDPVARAPRPATSETEGKPFGRYQLIRELGVGGMGVVWKAWDTQLSRHVALKMIRCRGHLQAKALERFLREARLAARLQHPGIVRLLDAGRTDGQPYFTSELVEGRLLEDFLDHALSMRTVVGWVKAVAEALQYAHDHGVIHRDVKPGNILLDAQGRPMVFDFGLAKEIVEAGNEEERPRVTSSAGAVLGTPDYMSPEQGLGPPGSLTSSTDLFSLGLVLYRLATGRLPFVKNNLRQLLIAIAEEEPVAPSKHNPRVDRDLETVILKAMEKEPARRYPSMSEFAADLGRWLEREPIHARAISASTRLWRKTVKHRAVVAPTAAALVLGLALAGFAFRHYSQAGREVATHLAAARVDRQAGRAQEADSHFRQVLAWDSENPEAKAGVAWANARLNENVAATEREKLAATDARKTAQATTQEAKAAEEASLRAQREAEARGRAARTAEEKALAEGESARLAMEKARAEEMRARELAQKPALVRQVLQRWHELAPALRDLEAAATRTAHALAVRRDHAEIAWEPFARFLAEAPADPASRATARSLAGWARWRGGWEEEGIAWMREARTLDAETPYGPLVEALAALDGALALVRAPLPSLGPSGLTLDGPPPAPREVAEGLDRAHALLDETARCAVWGGALAAPGRRALQATRDLLAGRAEAAEQGLGAVIGTGDLPVEPTSLLCARAHVRMLLRRFGAAAADLEEAVLARPDHAPTRLALADARLAEAADLPLRGRERVAAFEAARRAYDAAISADDSRAVAWIQRGIASWGLARALVRLGEKPAPAYAAADDDFDQAVRRDPASGRAYWFRGILRASLADDARLQGKPAGHVYASAGVDFDQALVRLPGFAPALLGRGWALLRQGEEEAADGSDPRPILQKSARDFEQALARDPELAEAYLGRAWAWVGLGRAAQALGEDSQTLYETAVGDAGEAIRLASDLAAAYEARGWAHARLGWAQLGARRNPRAECEWALAAFAESLRQDPDRASARHGIGVVHLVRDLSDPKAASLPAAIENFAKALEANPLEPEARAHLGLAWMQDWEKQSRHGSPHKAFEAFAQALATGGGRWRVLAHRASCYMLTGEFKRAAEDYDEAVKLAGGTWPRGRALANGARGAEDAVKRGIKPERVVRLVRGSRAFARDDHVGAFAYYDAADLGKSDFENVPGLRTVVADGYLNLARIYATMSRGLVDAGVDSLPTLSRCTANFPYMKDDPDGAGRATETAFKYLRLAVRLGGIDRAALETDPDFRGIRGGSRWRTILEDR